jgi:hypothetical protein
METVALASSACRRCGGNVRLAYETVPYIALGPRLVELRNVAVRRCSVCGHMGIDVPDVRALDVLVRCLCVESTDVMPRLEYADGRCHHDSILSIMWRDRQRSWCVRRWLVVRVRELRPALE